MRIFSMIMLAVLLLIAYACVPGNNVPTSTEVQLPPPATDADYLNNLALDDARVILGQALFFDKILSGNKNISCATCHSVLAATGDGLSLPIGEEGTGSSIFRNAALAGDHDSERVPRNAPALFNLGAREFNRMFADGRIESDPAFPSNLRTPAKSALPEGLNSPLAAQALFPNTSHTEMCGHPGENDLSKYCDDAEFPLIWSVLTERLRKNDLYVTLFKAAYPEIKTRQDVTMVHAANAIADFEATQWRADNSPFDRYLRGDKHAMSGSALAGMQLFYSKANCAKCHSGTFQTDQQFHAVAMPQFGPGKGDGFKGQDDFGREQVTGNRTDRYKFRTPSLRNVALTGPWGHTGAFNDLRGAVIRELDPVTALRNYDSSQVMLPPSPSHMTDDFAVMAHPETINQIAAANEIIPIRLSDAEIDDLLDFLHALTDPNSLDLRADAPRSVPSGLSLKD